MPTPSSPNDEAPPQSFVPTCPDDQMQHSSSSWHPPPPYPAAMDEDQSHGNLTGDDEIGSRSATMSPRPHLGRDGPAPDPDGIILPLQDPEDSHKQPDTDDDMVGTSHDQEVLRLRGPAGDIPNQVADGHVFIPPTRRRYAAHRSSDIPSPISAEGDKLEDPSSVGGFGWVDDVGLWTDSPFSNLRIVPTTPSSFLRPGSRFTGTQQSERQVYDVQVEIKHVDLRESFLCGYLRIQGLTEDHPTLTTYFEGEIIGSKYGFMTKHESWGASDRIDLSHWGKFSAFRQFTKQAKKGTIAIKDFAQKENIFMRWKEHFLVPDHRVRTINGASFEGFYYICFNQIEGKVSGIYFHAKSEKFQQLDLKHVEDRGCFGAMEFR